MGDFKPLMRLGEMTVLERIIRLFQSAGIRRVHVVVGHRMEDLLPLIDRWGAQSVVNARYAEGMFSSVAAGAKSLNRDTAAFFVLPVDIPLVRPATLKDLLGAFPPGKTGVCHPLFSGRRGHPPLIGGAHIDRLLAWHGNGGLAVLLNRLERHAADVAVVDEFIHADMDRPEDFQRLNDLLERRSVFSAAECNALLNERLRISPRVAAHGRAVADVATAIAGALNQAGFCLNLRLVYAAACVHDLARGMPDHARRGARILRDLDMPSIADIVASHTDIGVNKDTPVREAEVVFLADKMVLEDRFVGLANHFNRRSTDFAKDPRSEASTRRRLGVACQIAERIETVIGRSLEGLLSSGRFNGISSSAPCR
jgi:CTP:molybdopterin cytidylyltransferase MocA